MRGSCRGSAPEADLSRCSQTVSEIERANGTGAGVGEVGEAAVTAVKLRALVRLLDREGPARERFSRQLEHAVPPSPFGFLEQRDVDLGAEHRVRAAHVAVAAER